MGVHLLLLEHSANSVHFYIQNSYSVYQKTNHFVFQSHQRKNQKELKSIRKAAKIRFKKRRKVRRKFKCRNS